MSALRKNSQCSAQKPASLRCLEHRDSGVGVRCPDLGHRSTIVSAQDAVSSPKPSAEELAKLKQNPLSGLREIIFQAEVSPNVPGSGETFGSYSIQPVWPFSHAALPPPAKYDREAPPADLEN